MKKYLLFLGLFLALTQTAHATFVQRGVSNFATAASTACVTGTVTSGNVEVMAVDVVATTRMTISSTRVTTWKLAQAIVDASSIYIWYGVVTSSGAETVTASLTTGSAIIGSACLEYSGTVNLDATNGGAHATSLSLTTFNAATTVLEVGRSSSGSTDASSPFTSRAQITLTGTAFIAVGEVVESSQGTYSSAFTGGTIAGVEMISLSASASPPTKFVQVGAGDGGNSTTQTCVYPANVTSGDLLVVGMKANGVGISTITDTRSTSWTIDQNSANNSFVHGKATSSGADTVTITLAGLANAMVICSEYLGVVNLDVFNQNTSNASVAVTTTKPVTTLVYVVGDGTTFAMSSPFTPRMNGAMQSGPVGLVILGDVGETSTGTYTASSTAGGVGTNTLGAFYANAPANVPRHR